MKFKLPTKNNSPLKKKTMLIKIIPWNKLTEYDIFMTTRGKHTTINRITYQWPAACPTEV